jgi:putative transposase
LIREMEETGGRRYRSRVFMYAHFVWAVQWRAAQLTPEFERRIHRKIYAAAEEMGCLIYALNGMPDHVHLVVRLPGSVSPSNLIKRVKGSSSSLFNHLRPEFSERFDWQDGYGCFSIGQSEEELNRIIEYVRHQKQHHAANTVIAEWEETVEIIAQSKKPDVTEDFF